MDSIGRCFLTLFTREFHMREMPTTNSIPWALSFMEVRCKTNHPYYGSPLLIYINVPRALAKRRRPSVEEKGGSAILQIV